MGPSPEVEVYLKSRNRKVTMPRSPGIARDACALDRMQCNLMIQRLTVVEKHIFPTPAGTPGYFNPKGKWVYLSGPQKLLWQRGQLEGCVQNCNPDELRRFMQNSNWRYIHKHRQLEEVKRR